MNRYLDSGVIVKLYVPEPNTPEAIALVARQSPPDVLTEWQAVEVRNAVRLKRFRGEITPTQLRSALRSFAADERLGRWQRPVLDLGDTLRRAEVISRKYAPALGCRTLDIVHVAAAQVLALREMLSFDGRQRALARKVGLRVAPR